MSKPFKAVCQECGWCGPSRDLLTAPNPFALDETIYGCPSCKEVDCFLAACDEEGCWKPRTCGTPTAKGYRSTCSKHRPDEEAAEAAGGE